MIPKISNISGSSSMINIRFPTASLAVVCKERSVIFYKRIYSRFEGLRSIFLNNAGSIVFKLVKLYAND